MWKWFANKLLAILRYPTLSAEDGVPMVKRRFCNSVAVIGLLTIVSGCGKQNAYVPSPPPEATVATPVKQKVTRYLEETGSTRPVEMVEIRARVEGYLDKISFTPGSDVEAGDLLYKIQQREFAAKVKSAEAAEQNAEASIAFAEAEFKRQQEMIKEKATSQQKVDLAEATLKQAKASKKSAEASLDQAQLDLEYTDVTTPIAGRVGETLVKEGNLVGDGLATHLTTVVRYDPIHVYFNISERALLQATEGRRKEGVARVDVTDVKAFMRRATDKGFPFEGHLDYADLGVDQSTGTFMIRAVFPNPNYEIVPGLFVRVRIPMTPEPVEAMLIPEIAVLADQAGRHVMIVGDDDVVERRNIEMGSKYGNLVVVSAGLNGDERVVVNGVQRARPGAKVTPKEISLEPVQGTLESVKQGVTNPPEALPQTSGDANAPRPETDSSAKEPDAPDAAP